VKKKLAIVVPSLRGGGAERVMVNIIRHIDTSKFDIRLILIKKEGPYVQFIPEHIPVIDLNSNRVRFAIVKLIKELNKYKPDVILSTLGYLNLALISIKPFLKGGPKIIVRHAISPTKSLEKYSNIKRSICKKVYRILYNKSDIILAQCEEMKKDIAEVYQIDEGKIRYIYNPLDIKKIQSDMQKQNPYNTDKFNLISAGRFTYQKGFDILLKAFKIVHKKHPNTHLTILGEGVLKEELIITAQKLGLDKKVTFAGFQENPYPYYYYSDMFILSSRYEGFPNTLLEALACKTKVISTQCKNGPKEIIGCNDYGLLAEVENNHSLANSILRYMSMESLTQNRCYSFDIKKIIQEYELLINEQSNIKGFR